MNVKQIPLIIPSLEPDEKLPRLLAQLRQAGIENIVLVTMAAGRTTAISSTRPNSRAAPFCAMP